MFTKICGSEFRELPFPAAQTAVLECADNPEEFARIQRAIFSAIRQTLTEPKGLAFEEVHK